jgi:prophage tail gpP-like protein
MTSCLRRRALAMLALGLALSGCEFPFGPDRAVVLFISDLDAPASVDAGETIVVKVTVESGGCRRFDRLEATRVAGRVTFRAHGRDSSGPKVSCTADIRYNVVEYDARPPLTDPFVLVAFQPDKTELTRTVRVIAR